MSYSGDYETLDTVRLSDSSEEFVRRDSVDTYYNKIREKKHCMYLIIYFIAGFSIISLFFLIGCIFIKAFTNMIN